MHPQVEAARVQHQKQHSAAPKNYPSYSSGEGFLNIKVQKDPKSSAAHYLLAIGKLLWLN